MQEQDHSKWFWKRGFSFGGLTSADNGGPAVYDGDKTSLYKSSNRLGKDARHMGSILKDYMNWIMQYG